MNINDLIEREGEQIFRKRKLVIPEVVTSLEGIERLSNLTVLVLSLSIRDYSALNSSSLKKTLRTIMCSDIFESEFGLKNLLFFDGYALLELISLDGCVNILDYSGLNSSSLKKTVKRINLNNNINLRDTSFLEGYEMLEEINLKFCYRLSDYSALNSSSLKRTVKKIALQGNRNLKDITFLDGYERLEDISISGTNVQDIYDLPNYEFVKNGSLKKISLPESINWLKIVDGKYANTEAVHKLREMGVTVELPSNFPYEPDIEPKPKLYIICGPSGAGKSALIRYMKEELGVKQLGKVTTRDYRTIDEARLGEIIKISAPQFKEKLNRGEILAYRNKYGAEYGIDYLDFLEARLSNDVHLVDSSDIESALRLREANPDYVQIIMVMTSPQLIVQGLEDRMRKLKDKHNTQTRIATFEEDYAKYSPYLPYADQVLDGSYEENRARIKQAIMER